MKMKDILTFNNWLFQHDQIDEKLSSTFTEYFMTGSVHHNYNTKRSQTKTITTTIINSTTYGINFKKNRAASD